LKKRLTHNCVPVYTTCFKNDTQYIIVYPDSVRCMDDQSMLPLHLARVYGSSQRVVDMLYNAYPHAAATADAGKKNVPVQVAPNAVMADQDQGHDKNANVVVDENNPNSSSRSNIARSVMLEESILDKDQFCTEPATIADSISNKNDPTSQMKRAMANAVAANTAAAAAMIQEIRKENQQQQQQQHPNAESTSCCFGTEAVVIAGDDSITSSRCSSASSTSIISRTNSKQLLQESQKTISELQQKILEIEHASGSGSIVLRSKIEELEHQVQSWKYSAWNSRVAAIKAEFTAMRIQEQLQQQQQQQDAALMVATRQQSGTSSSGTTRDDKESKREEVSPSEFGSGSGTLQTSSLRTMESNLRHEEQQDLENMKVSLHSTSASTNRHQQQQQQHEPGEEEFVGVEVSLLKYPMRTMAQQQQQQQQQQQPPKSLSKIVARGRKMKKQ
jgi:hypothetical protein